MTNLSIVVPVYNEEKNIRPFLERIEKVLSKIGKKYEIIFALDPSKDLTEKIILEEINRNNNIKLILVDLEDQHQLLHNTHLYYNVIQRW